MNNPVIQMCNIVRKQEVEMQIATQCAPLLTGIKMSNILITHSSNKEIVYAIFKNSSINVKCIHLEDDRITLLLYKADELLQYIKKSDVQRLMTIIGYKDMNIENILDRFAWRFTMHMLEGKLFPHEIGILLGYPVQDVVGFIENKGKNCLYTGYWKVYSNLLEALNTFNKYNHAKEVVTRLVSNGMSINKILKIYQSSNKKVALNQLIAV